MYFSSPRVPSFKSILGDAFKLRQPDAFFKNFMNLYFFKAENPIVKKKNDSFLNLEMCMNHLPTSCIKNDKTDGTWGVLR